VQTLFRDVKLSLSQDTDTSADTTTDTDTLFRSRSVGFAVLRVSTLRMCKKGVHREKMDITYRLNKLKNDFWSKMEYPIA